VLLAACRPAGTCTTQAALAATRSCFESGVKVTVVPNPLTLGFAMAVTRPDGVTPCYAIEFARNLPGGGRGVVFRNGAGTEIGRGVADAAGRIMLSCEAGPTLLEDTCVPLGRIAACQPGTCR
jgi:hypothetical protein